MVDTYIILTVLWIAVMLTYLLGDVFRIFSGDIDKMPKEIKNMGQLGWLGLSALMVMPIVMVVLSVVLPYEINRWVNIIAAGFFFLFNLFGLPSYSSHYDRFLLVVSMVFNAMTISYAWNWIN